MIDVELIGAPAFAVTVEGDTFTYAAINARLSDVISVLPADFVGQTPESLLSSDYAAEVLGHYRRCAAERVSVAFESFYDAPGGGRWWHTTVTPVLEGQDGRVALLVGVGVDITPRKLAERSAREVDARIALAMDVLEGGFWHYAIASDRFLTSPQLSRLVTGHDAPLDGPGFAAFIVPEHRAGADFGALVRGEVDRGEAEYQIRMPDGGLRWMQCRRRLTRDDAGRPENLVGVVVDITEQKARQARLRSEAATDSLTGLGNRRALEEAGAALMARARDGGEGFGLALVDLDRFKPVNDTHGHAVGDAVLREVAARLRAEAGASAVVARLGGDEFALLVEGAGEAALAELSRRLVSALARPIATAAGPVGVGASVGATPWHGGDRDLASPLGRADALLFEVKRAGRGAWRVAA